MSLFIASTPNTEKDDVLLAKRLVRGRNISENSVEKLTTLYPKGLFFNRGREAIFFLLRSLGLGEGDEIILQPFTCIAVVAPIIWSNAKPIYVDIEKNTFNMDLNLLKKRITKKTRLIIAQHTFGNLLDMEALRDIVNGENQKRKESERIYILEDCAHLFPSDFEDIGKYSDFSLFSFAQDKAISCTQGSMLHIPDDEVLKGMREEHRTLKQNSNRESMYNARYILYWEYIKRFYYTKLIPFSNITIGRVALMVLRFLGCLRKQASIESLEVSDPVKMGDVQAEMLFHQISKVEKFNNHRERIVRSYKRNIALKKSENLSDCLLRFPILVKNRDEVLKEFKKKEIIIGSWYTSPVFPLDSKDHLSRVGYELGSCPNCEFCNKYIINLPTNIHTTEEDALDISDVINRVGKEVKL